jgi:hypothetical protein
MGQYGAKKTLVNSALDAEKNYVWFNDFDDLTRPDWTREVSLALTLEAPSNIGDRLGHKFQAWFLAPLTTRYKFYMSCNDDCIFLMDTTAGSDATPTELISNVYSTDFREFWRQHEESKQSVWVDLVAGEHYYIELQAMEHYGGDHASVAVEIEQSDIVGHHQSFKELQKLNIAIDNNFDTFRVTVLNPDGGEYILNFQDREDLTVYHQSWPITANGDAGHMYNKVNEYCWYQFGSYCGFVMEMFDAADLVTLDPALTVKNVYTVHIKKLISGPSTNNILVAKTTTTSTITVELPSEVQLSSTPLSGSYSIKCVDSEAFESTSTDIPWHNWANWVTQKTMEGCDRFYDRIEMWETRENEYKENGVGLYVKFQGLNEDPGQFEIMSSDTDPLLGDNIVFTFETVTPYSTNLWYEPVPFEMLKTYETKPQVIVSVDGAPAVCHNLTCDYTYVDAVGEVTSFTFNAGAGTVSITGTSFDISPITEVKFAMAKCTVDPATLSATNIDCTLDKEPTCGTFIPKVLAEMGKIPTNAAVVGAEVACTVTSVTPATGLNLFGGDNITISGTNFPHKLPGSTFDLKFDDTQTTICVTQSSSTTSLVCLTSAFDTVASSGASVGMTITINDLIVANSLSLTMKSTTDSGLTIIPSSASPVLKS